MKETTPEDKAGDEYHLDLLVYMYIILSGSPPG